MRTQLQQAAAAGIEATCPSGTPMRTTQAAVGAAAPTWLLYSTEAMASSCGSCATMSAAMAAAAVGRRYSAARAGAARGGGWGAGRPDPWHAMQTSRYSLQGSPGVPTAPEAPASERAIAKIRPDGPASPQTAWVRAPIADPALLRRSQAAQASAAIFRRKPRALPGACRECWLCGACSAIRRQLDGGSQPAPCRDERRHWNPAVTIAACSAARSIPELR